MESSAVAKYIRISPRKVRLIMDELRGRKVEEALNMLSFTPLKGGRILKKLINFFKILPPFCGVKDSMLSASSTFLPRSSSIINRTFLGDILIYFATALDSIT